MGQRSYVAFFTNSSVKVLDKSMVLPLTSGLNALRTLTQVGGPSGGMIPVGLKMPFSLSRAAT